MKEFTVAVIGAGQIARTRHIPNYNALPGVRVAGVCDVNADAARRTAEELGIDCWDTDAAALLRRCRPDAVSVCVPNRFHCESAETALLAGCHVLCEKPPAMTVAQARHMEELARSQGLQLSYGFHLRHLPETAALHRAVQAGELGEIYAARVEWLRRRGIPGWGCFTDCAMQGGGPLIDLGAHMLDLALYLMEYPKVRYVCAAANDRIGKQGGVGQFGPWDGARYTVEDCLLGQVFFENGATLLVETSFAMNIPEQTRRSLWLYGDKQSAGLFPPTRCDGEGAHPQPEAADFDPYRAEVENFVAACRGQAPLLVRPEQGTAVQQLIGLLYRSARTGLPATPDEA